MVSERSSFRIYKIPVIKKMGMDMLEHSKSAHHISCLAEIDVSDYRDAIKTYRRRSGKGLSLLAFTLANLARAIHENPCMQTFQLGSNRVMEFREVDLAVMIEKRFKNVYIPSTYIVRNASEKTVDLIHDDLERFLSLDLESDSPFANRESTPLFKIYPYLPKVMRMLALRWIGKNPLYIRKIGGTTLVTSLSNFGRVPAWVLPLASYPLIVGIGTMTKKPWAMGDQVKVREIQNLTFQFNHDFIDGADAARFISCLKRAMDEMASKLG